MPDCRYALDANAFIDARRRWYPFAVCPGYWDALAWHMGSGVLCSIDKVLAELHDAELQDWIAAKNLAPYFMSSNTEEIGAIFSQLMSWVVERDFTPAAKEEFADAENADGWLVAYAKANSLVVATHERSDPLRRNKVQVPDLCDQFGVRWTTPFDMLKELDVQFNWAAPAAYKADSDGAPVVMERLYL